MGLSVSYLTVKRLLHTLAGHTKTKIRRLPGDHRGWFVLGWDNINWMKRTRDTSISNHSRMESATAGQIHITDDLYILLRNDRPKATPAFFERIMGVGIPYPLEDMPIKLRDLVPDNGVSGDYHGVSREPLDSQMRAAIPPHASSL